MQQDYIVRQIQALAQVLARVLVSKRSDQPVIAQQALADGLARVTGLDLPALRGLSRDEALALCAPGGALGGDTAVALAEVLAHDASPDGRRRALWLYEWALASGGAVPFDVHERLASLRASLTPPVA